VFLLDPDSGADVGQQIFEGEREVLLAADMTQQIAWVHVPPQSASSGTGREDRAQLPGTLVALDSAGKELTRIETGQTRFSQLTGDWSSARALLARDGVGVLLADCGAGKSSWALRNGGDVQLHLLAGGAQLWAILPDGIAGILASKLVRLGPQLTASKVLPREQLQPVRRAVEALGWDWKSTVISPLSANVGRFTLFESADPGSQLAELDWSPSRKHVCRLLAARDSGSSDAEFARLTPEQQRLRMGELLTALGWPTAVVDEARTLSTEIESAFTYTLQPAAQPGYSAGEFSLWQGDSVLLTLDAPTAPLPDGVIAMEAAGAKALETITVAKPASPEIAVDANGAAGAAGSAPTIQSTHAGWVLPGSDTLLPEAEGDAIPAYEVHLRSALPECRQYRVLLNAQSGDVLAVHEGKCSPLHLAAQ
nr:hypothetical protein [bacterium]